MRQWRHQLARIAGGAQPQMYVGNLASVAIFLMFATYLSRRICRSRAAAKAPQIYNVAAGAP